MAQQILISIFIIRSLNKVKKLTEKEYKDAAEYLKCMDTLWHVISSPNTIVRHDGEVVKDGKEMAFTLFKVHAKALTAIMEKYVNHLDDIDDMINISCDHEDIMTRELLEEADNE